MRSIRSWLWVVMLCAAWLSGCKSGSQHMAPIDQLDQPPSIRLQSHVVSKGDTLYGIAWRYGMDFHELASLNGIRAPYKIYTGQKLALAEQHRQTGATAMPVSEGVHAVSDDGGVREISGAGESGVREVTTPVQPERRQPATQEVMESPTRPVPAKAASGSGTWVWPARGQLIGRYVSGNPRQKGIDIAGSNGDPVVAAAAGSVVYAGSGLAGYGQLVIVKHNEQFLSAYAHNSRLLVAEGDAVRQGQQIAEMGATETDRTKLHFEIRQSGKPVDPMQFLPAK